MFVFTENVKAVKKMRKTFTTVLSVTVIFFFHKGIYTML